MRQVKLVSNSADSQIAEAANLFQSVERAARDYEQHQGHSTELLHTALAELFEFGELLRTKATEPDRSLVEEFVQSKGLPWSKATRRNPYIAFVKLAFAQSPSSQSQYAAVLLYASDTGVLPNGFKDWLQIGGGIKGRHPEALEHAGSAKRLRNNQARASRLKSAINRLMDMEHSSPVALPRDVTAPEGFALVLARIDAAGHASIVDVAHTSAAVIEPILLEYEPSNISAKNALAAEPLGRLHRAIDLILGCTADEFMGHERHLLVFNTLERGQPICRIEAISEAYTYMWAGVTLSGHLEELPARAAMMIAAEDAAFFRADFPTSTGWTLSSDPTPRIHNARHESPIKLHQLQQNSYRMGVVPPSRSKPVSVSYADQTLVLQFLRDRLAEHDRHNARRKAKQRFASTLTMQLDGGTLEVGLPKMLGAKSLLGRASPDRELADRALDIGELKRVLSTLAPYETGVEGTFVDTDVSDAALCLQTWFDDDLFSVVVPTRSGTAINQSCTDLDLGLSN